ncbi:tRNA pseudouridine(55) synthase TruB [Butyrivibrio sp. WCD3002]|uniref:tRNA pseudouridine(55) synthase TruB n=1 Tax=Butyrivibrio sp. WCD3002 TaxID=1280676 RepID=UPI00041EE9E7|nr:tRNA pseudouridine(55) synthase TruB [Butyrivibrio sp. WCD3002]
MYNGLINVYKEAGYTSSDVVARLRGILKMKKIGHTGTLDPDAVGVLVICVGNGTKLCDMLTDHNKEYIAVCRLGVTTDTQDMSGRVLTESEVNVSSEKLHETVKKFVGEYDQIPPMYSAIKINGKKLYELARQGKEVERKPRRINIQAITILDESHLQDEHIFTMEVKCSKGTYIRTLCNDIGEALGCGAAMEHLTRTAVGSFHLETAHTLDQIEQLRDEGRVDEIVASTESLFRDLDYCIVKDDFRKKLENGNGFKVTDLVSEAPEDEQDFVEPEKLYADGTRVRVYGEDGAFFGIYKCDERTGTFRVEKFFYTV